MDGYFADSFLIMSLISLFTLGLFKFLHQGACASSGYLAPNTIQGTIYDCRQECKGRAEVKYFAYVSGSTCACYKTECKVDGAYKKHMAFEILDPNQNEEEANDEVTASGMK